MTTTNTPTTDGLRLREARERAGLTRARLAALTQCSLTSLSNIEAGAVPRRSAVYQRAWRILAAINAPINSKVPAENRDLAQPGDRDAGHATTG